MLRCPILVPFSRHGLLEVGRLLCDPRVDADINMNCPEMESESEGRNVGRHFSSQPRGCFSHARMRGVSSDVLTVDNSFISGVHYVLCLRKACLGNGSLVSSAVSSSSCASCSC